MDSIVIEGGAKISGEIEISGAKNAALPIIASCLLSPHKIILKNIPKVSDIITMCDLLKSHGANVRITPNIGLGLNLEIEAKDITNFTSHYDIVRKMRASIWTLAPLIARFGKAIVSFPGGCAIGARQIDMHLDLLESMGATLKIEHGYIYAKGALQGTEFCFHKISVGATITGVMAASITKGNTVLLNCSNEPEVVDLCKFLSQIGAKIDGIGTNTLKIAGTKDLSGTEYRIIADRIEAGTYMIAAALTKGNLCLTNIDYDIVENTVVKLKEANIQINHKNGKIYVNGESVIKAVDIETCPYPGFATDLQAQFMTLMIVAHGTSIVTETIFENRFMHVPELCRMGADITLNGHTAKILGVDKIEGAEVMASDLRASVSLILAGLRANGKTKVRRVYHLDRGYENLVSKLEQCGAKIKRISGDKV